MATSAAMTSAGASGAGASAPGDALAWHVYAVVFGATCVLAGVIWDISWHMSIGRDTFWTPAHLLIQAGGLIAGLTSGYVALRTTFAGPPGQRAAAVSFWGFRAPLGAWVCVWGCGAMLTSAPFDDWWHNAYGLDVKIVSPPHMILMLGITSIVTGALLLTLARQNRADSDQPGAFGWLFLYAAGLLLTNAAVALTEYSDKTLMHGAAFYRISLSVYPVVLVAVARASRLRWPATKAALVYMAFTAVLMWVLQLFPATPKLGPIYQHITHMVGMDFPLLLVAPAFAVDCLLLVVGTRSRWWALAPGLAVAFLAAFMLVQWPFANFLLSPAARNWFFNADNFVYWMPSTNIRFLHQFQSARPGAPSPEAGLLLALAQGAVASALGLGWGAWMKRVRR
jgi:hypothetical protein